MSVEPISLDVLLASVGKEVGVSPWRVVTQRMIDQFADATDDHQFIHCDPERAKRETPFGGTIAHGDYRLDNLIFAPDRPRVIAVLDWELSTSGHPVADIAYQCMYGRNSPVENGD